jgi:hypothetical protein
MTLYDDRLSSVFDLNGGSPLPATEVQARLEVPSGLWLIAHRWVLDWYNRLQISVLKGLPSC